MHSDSQSSAHRVQPPPRLKPRWQPYPSQSLGSILATSELNTPKPSVPPSPLPSVSPPSIHSNPHPPKDPIQRDIGKQKYALGLIDQAVKTLFEIWRPEDIPPVFVGPPKGPSSLQSSQSLVSTGAETDSALLPLKSFVHEVLKRSRTSGSIMQTALCYLEAVRPKVPELLRDEKLGVRSYFMPESTILPATEAELRLDQQLSNLQASTTSDHSVHLTNEDTDIVSDHRETSTMAPEPTVTHTTACPLPSPLLCPRRTFLAALILASKFSQDKCYSNRAWAKLSGLPPREIGRCERALGQALDWRLWVGKKTLTSPPTVSRTVVRTQSESCISILPSLREPFLRPSEPKRSDQTCPNLEAPSMTGRGLHRSSTVPMEGFTGSRLLLKHSESLVKNHEDSRKDISWKQVYASSDSSSGSNTSSPDTPPLSHSPSTSGDRTIQVASYEEGMFPSYSTSHPKLLDDSRLTPPSVCSSSPSTFVGSPVSAPLAEGKLAAMQLQISLAETISESLWSSRLGVVAGSHLWHADGGYLSLGSAPVH